MYEVPPYYNFIDGLWVPTEEGLHERVSEACHRVGIPYGMYFCVNSFFPFTGIREWGLAQGYGLGGEQCFCPAEPTYREAILARILDCAERYKLGAITFDMMWQGNGFGCRNTGHDHLVEESDPHGRYGTEAVVEMHLDMFARLRRINPDIVISIMSYDCWGSPWWLEQGDNIHAVLDDTPPSLNSVSPRFRDHLIECRDEQLYDLHRVRRRAIPVGNDTASEGSGARVGSFMPATQLNNDRVLSRRIRYR